MVDPSPSAHVPADGVPGVVSPWSRRLAYLREEARGLVLTRWIFLRLLGMAYLAAFGSLAVQVRGLIGEQGLLPAGEFLAAVRAQLGATEAWLRLPTLFWLGHSDAALVGVCLAGAALALMLIAGPAPAPCLAGLWALYLSLTCAGQRFLGYQWDGLLLEAGFLAIFLAPWKLRPRLLSDPPPPWPAVWLLRWLLFRVYFSSGVVKLASLDPHWRDLTALAFHYESQPLPTWAGWFAFHLPLPVQMFSCLAMFFIELVAPWFLFAPLRVRRLGAALLLLLQGLIALTGNYAFFNLLTVALCLLCLDDAFLLRRLPRRWRARVERRKELAAAPAPPGLPQRALTALAAAAILPCSLAVMAELATGQPARLPLLGPVQEVVSNTGMVGRYGLFAVMTTGRREIGIEGSDDGVSWRAWRWRWKPDDPGGRPRFVAPHQPRLDWQMWFAALGDRGSLRIVERLMLRLLQGSRPVEALLGPSPFPNGPPKFVRAVVDDCRMTDWARWRRTGNWWRIRWRGVLIGPVSLRDFGAAGKAGDSP